MTVLEQMSLTLDIPLWEDPPGVLRVGKSRVLLEFVIRAFQRGQTPQGIVQSYTALTLPDVHAVVSADILRGLHRRLPELEVVRMRMSTSKLRPIQSFWRGRLGKARSPHP